MIVPSYHYMVGPAAALLAFAFIVLICRWVFSTRTRDERTAKRLAASRTRGDYGLLVPIASARSQVEAHDLRDRLRAAGVRCTVAPGAGSQVAHVVLVFRADAERARSLVVRE